MIKGGNATIFVSNMDRAVRFYTDVLGLKLEYRAGDHWASIDAGNGTKLGLHHKSENAATPGTRGSIQVGFDVTDRSTMRSKQSKSRGGIFKGVIPDDDAARMAFINDPDGNELYLCELKK